MDTSPERKRSSRSTATSWSRLVLHAVDPRPLQDAGQLARGLLAGRRVGDDLGQHRVVVGRHLAAGLEAGVDPDAVLERDVEQRERPALRLVVGGRVLGVQPHLDRVAPRRVGPAHRPVRLGRGDLQLDEVDPVHQLGDRVLDLEAGVHLQEPEPLGGRVVEELDRAGAAVVDRLGRLAGGVVERGADLLAQARCRRLLHHLLVSALQRAVPVAVDAACRRPGPRRAGRARRTARRRPSRRRTPTPPRPARPRSRGPGRRARGRPSCRGRRHRRTP